MTIPVPDRTTDAPALSFKAIVRRSRDPALTFAAFGLVLAVVFGFGPFREPGGADANVSALHGAGGNTVRGEHLAGLSR